MLAGWGAAQGTLWLMGVSAMRDGLVLDATGLGAGEYWRFASYQLIHTNVFHWFGTLALLLLAGRDVEPIIGRRHVLLMCLVANLAGGAVSWSIAPETGVFGSMAAAAALATAYATILPELEFRVRLFWIFPVCYRTRHAVWLMLAIAGGCIALGIAGSVGPAGIFAGALIGWLWARILGFGRLLWFQRAASEREALERRRDRMTSEEFISAEIDPILEKIGREGMRSLTRSERKLLERAKEKLGT